MRKIIVAGLFVLSALLLAAGQTSQREHHSGAAKPAMTGQKTQKIKIYLVALSDGGKKGKKIGCDDSLVAVTRTIKATPAPLKAAIEELLRLPHEYNQELGNYWQGDKLTVKSATIRQGTATIYITGTGPYVAGICDEPRIMSQIEETAKQFSTVKRVKVFVNGESLSEAIR